MFKDLNLNFPKNKTWDQKNPILNLRELKTQPLEPTPALIRAYNSTGNFLGLGLYSPETPHQLRYLAGQEDDLYDILKNLLVQAQKHCQSVTLRYNCYRLIHPYGNLLTHLIIENYNGFFIITTESSAHDLLINTLTQVLLKEEKAKGVYLKNNSPTRARQNLLLTEALLAGEISDPLFIQEDRYHYQYDLDSTNLFPLQLRALRSWLNDFLFCQNQNNHLINPLLLFAGHQEKDLISQENQSWQSQTRFIEMTSRSYSEICEQLRALQKEQTAFCAVVFKQPSVTDLNKNQTALFHIYYNLIKVLAEDACLFLETTDWRQTQKILLQVESKCRRRLQFLEMSANAPDFPVALKKEKEQCRSVKIRVN